MSFVNCPPAARKGAPPRAIPVWLIGGPHSGVERTVRGLMVAATLCAAFQARAATYVVDGSNSGCSDSGPGTSGTPYCTIGAALTAHHGSGTTIQVKPGTYREDIRVPGSGASGSPLVLQADGASGEVVIEGADDFGSAGQWSADAGSTWLAAAVTWSPLQVFADGARLTASTAPPASMPSGTFQWVGGSGLYVNLGGANPGNHGTLVGRRPYGVLVSGKSWVTVDGFTLVHQEARALRAAQSSDVTFSDNTASWSAGYGILADSSTSVRILSNVVTDNGYHGIGLIMHSQQCTVDGNESARNKYVPVRQANGIYMFSASNNLIRNNRLHHNDDSGFNIAGGSNDNVITQNRSWSNGDHGFDHLNSSGNILDGDVAWGNFKDGFSFEGSAINHQLWNSIAVDNGLTTNEFDLWVDNASTSGFQSNDNLFWNSTSQAPVKYVSTLYTSVATYSAASGQDSRTLQSDPRFVDAGGGDFHLTAASPAIDNANSGAPEWTTLDAEGNARMDDASVTNTGLGTVTYADRGALEFLGGSGAAVPAASTDGNEAPPRMTPNPTHGIGQLTFITRRAGPLRIEILDAGGRSVRTLFAGEDTPAGAHAAALDGRRADGSPLEAGIYWYTIRSADGVRSGRFVVMR